MNIIDVIIVLSLLMGAVVGFKRGFTNQLVRTVGLVLVVILAFVFKNRVSIFFYNHLPFFDFWGIFKGVTVLNILLYEVLAFLVVAAVLGIVLKVIIVISGLFEKLLKLTVVLAIPSKILGAVLGIVEFYVILFILLYIFALPIINFSEINSSKYGQIVLKETPVLSTYVEKSIDVIDEVVSLKEKYEDATDADEFNKEALDVFLKYKIITVEATEHLVDEGKIDIENVDELLDKYR